jgi:hypothetical protein
MLRLWVPMLEGASRVLDLSATAFTQRRSRSVADLRRAADIVTVRAGGSEAKRIVGTAHTTKLFVSNLPYHVSNDDLRQAFAPFGEVISAAIIVDRATGRSKGFGFVEMAHISERSMNLLDDAQIWGRRVAVSEARPKSEARPDPVRQPRRMRPLPERGPVEEVAPLPERGPVEEVGLAMELPILVEIVLPGSERDGEADRVLSGVGS